MRLGSVLRKWRLMTELTVREVAASIGISAATLCRFENGENIDGQTMAKILRWLFEKSLDNAAMSV